MPVIKAEAHWWETMTLITEPDGQLIWISVPRQLSKLSTHLMLSFKTPSVHFIRYNEYRKLTFPSATFSAKPRPASFQLPVLVISTDWGFTSLWTSCSEPCRYERASVIWNINRNMLYQHIFFFWEDPYFTLRLDGLKLVWLIAGACRRCYDVTVSLCYDVIIYISIKEENRQARPFDNPLKTLIIYRFIVCVVFQIGWYFFCHCASLVVTHLLLLSRVLSFYVHIVFGDCVSSYMNSYLWLLI